MIAGKYRVERVLGVGGMGTVVAASHVGLGQSVAIKLMLPDLAASAEFSARFIREARAAASIRGEHVVRVFDVAATAEGTLYMVMELLEGDDLSELARARGPLPIEEAVGHLLQACDALAEAHAQGIVHRDLKPGNLFLAHRGGGPPVLKVLDFGISKSSKLDAAQGGATLTTPESMLGSPYYMSPEQLRSSKSADARSDIWSLGLILHKLITGFSAFESESMGEHLSMIAADPPTPLRLRRPDAPEALEAVVLRCLEKDVSRRFQNVGQLAAALAPFAPAGSQRLLDHIVKLLGSDALAPLAPLSPASPASPPSPASERVAAFAEPRASLEPDRLRRTRPRPPRRPPPSRASRRVLAPGGRSWPARASLWY